MTAGLVPITPESHGVELDLAYARADNIAGRPIYRRGACWLQAEAAGCLGQAAALARPLGLRLRIFDAFRPVEAQWALYRACPDPDYISVPGRGSTPHCRGVAVDLTLVDAASGRALDMGTGFDDMRPASHHGGPEVPAEAARNRLTLLGLMSTAGWDFYAKEWWHYQMFSPRAWPVLSDTVLPAPMVG